MQTKSPNKIVDGPATGQYATEGAPGETSIPISWYIGIGNNHNPFKENFASNFLLLGSFLEKKPFGIIFVSFNIRP